MPPHANCHLVILLLLCRKLCPSSQTSGFKVPHLCQNRVFIREEIIQASLTMKRSGEELRILKSDMICTVQYWFHRRETIVNKLKALEHSSDTLYIRGAKNMLRKM